MSVKHQNVCVCRLLQTCAFLHNTVAHQHLQSLCVGFLQPEAELGDSDSDAGSDANKQSKRKKKLESRLKIAELKQVWSRSLTLQCSHTCSLLSICFAPSAILSGPVMVAPAHMTEHANPESMNGRMYAYVRLACIIRAYMAACSVELMQ